MRFRTIKRRLRLSLLDEEELRTVYEEMSGIPDKAILDGEGQKKWIRTLQNTFLARAVLIMMILKGGII